MESLIYEALKDVIDPEFGLNVVDLGLIYDVSVRPEEVEVTMTLTTPNCPMHEVIVGGVEYTVATATRKPAKITMVWDPAWTPERISEHGLRQLNGI